MRIAVTTAGGTLDAPIDTRFGRAPKFLIYDTDFDTYHVKPNEQNVNAAQGAGIQSAMHVCDEHVDCVITGHCGPKAYATLNAAGVAVYTCPNSSVGEAIEQLKLGKLSQADAANVEAHWV